MKPAVAQRQLHSSGSLAEGKFGISTADQVHILSILRDRLYTNKILAVLREYASNAWDAHRDAGRHRLPIRVRIPNALDPELVIRDWGPGLSEEDIFEVYVKYGASTKRTSNEAVGMLGIGAKSAFAYSDQFTVTSWNGGMKRVYVGALDETDVGVMTKMHEEPCPDEETGIRIAIPVDPKDIWNFEREAGYLFPFFDPLPEINIPLVTQTGNPYSAGFLRKWSEGGHLPNWVAVMGCVPYNLNFHQLRGELELRKIITHTILKGGLRFNIGDVDVSANREELEYTDRTKAAVLDKIETLTDELWEELRAKLCTFDTSWAKRLAVRGMVRELGIKPPENMREWGGLTVPLYATVVTEEGTIEGNPKTFRLNSPKKGPTDRWTLNRTKDVVVAPDARILIRDSFKPLRGHIQPHEKLRVLTVMPKDSSGSLFSIGEVMAELQGLLKEAGLGGMPVEKLSTYAYVLVSARGRSDSKSAKHTKRTFVLESTASQHFDRASDCWALAEEGMGFGDPFVLLERFIPRIGRRFYSRIGDDREIFASVLGCPMPLIYGVKTTDKRPVDPADLIGTPYRKWFQEFIEEELTSNKTAIHLIETHRWAQLAKSLRPPGEETMAGLRGRLDGRHSIIRMYSRLMGALEERHKWGRGGRVAGAVQRLINYQHDWHRVKVARAERKGRKRLPKPPTNSAKIATRRILEKYPLLSAQHGGPGINVFLTKNRDAWLDYINLVDNS